MSQLSVPISVAWPGLTAAVLVGSSSSTIECTLCPGKCASPALSLLRATPSPALRINQAPTSPVLRLLWPAAGQAVRVVR